MDYRDKIEAGRDARHGFYIPTVGDTCWKTLDGADVAAWLRGLGYDVVRHYDTGNNGIAETACGVAMSTSGYVCYFHHEETQPFNR